MLGTTFRTMNVCFVSPVCLGPHNLGPCVFGTIIWGHHLLGPTVWGRAFRTMCPLVGPTTIQLRGTSLGPPCVGVRDQLFGTMHARDCLWVGPPFGTMGVWDPCVFGTSFGTMGVWTIVWDYEGVWEDIGGRCLGPLWTMSVWDHCLGLYRLGPSFGTMFGTTVAYRVGPGVWDHGCSGPVVWDHTVWDHRTMVGTIVGCLELGGRTSCLGPRVFGTSWTMEAVWDLGPGVWGPWVWDHGCLGPRVSGTTVSDHGFGSHNLGPCVWDQLCGPAVWDHVFGTTVWDHTVWDHRLWTMHVWPS